MTYDDNTHISIHSWQMTKIRELINDLKYGKYDVQVIRDVEGSEDIVETVAPHLLPHLAVNIIVNF